MGSFVVELIAKVVELTLLGAQVCGGGTCGFVFERTVHAFMTSVLLRLAWLNEFGHHAKPNPPCRQHRQPCQRGGSKRHAIIGTHARGQSELLEESSKHWFGSCDSGGVKRLATQQVTAV